MIGSYRHRLSYQISEVSGTRPNGQEIREWHTLFATWAEIKPLNGREVHAAGQTHATLTHRITLRYRPSITPEGRFVTGSRVFNVVSVVDEDERHRTLIVTAVEQT
jgi:SPP1 family predicted phage head-tail adaptor